MCQTNTDGNLLLHEVEIMELFTIIYAQAFFLKGEYSGMLAQGFTDADTARVFKTLERNPGLFSEKSMKHLTAAAEITALKNKSQQSQRPLPRRGGYNTPPSQSNYKYSGYQNKVGGGNNFMKKKYRADADSSDTAPKSTTD